MKKKDHASRSMGSLYLQWRERREKRKENAMLRSSLTFRFLRLGKRRDSLLKKEEGPEFGTKTRLRKGRGKKRSHLTALGRLFADKGEKHPRHR